MMKRFLAWLLLLTLITSAEARERTLPERARRIARGSKVVVTLKDKQFLRGRLGGVAQDRFTLEPVVAGDWPDRELLFQDVQDVLKIREHSIVDYTFGHVFMIPVALVMLPFVLLYCGVFDNDCGSFP